MSGTRSWSPSDPLPYPDPDIVALSPRFRRYMLVWSDIPNDLQLRYIEDDGRVTVFRRPSGQSNGNTFDHQGRQLACEHLARRVARYEPDGTVTTIADLPVRTGCL